MILRPGSPTLEVVSVAEDEPTVVQRDGPPSNGRPVTAQMGVGGDLVAVVLDDRAR